MTQDLEALGQLFGCYLHQDFVDFYDTDTAAIQDMLASEPNEDVAAAANQIQGLLSSGLNEAELEKIVLYELGSYFAPSSKGQTYHEWLSEVYEIFSEHLATTARLAKTYGGKAGDWHEVISTRYLAPDGTEFETHGYKNKKTGQVTELRVKFTAGELVELIKKDEELVKKNMKKRPEWTKMTKPALYCVIDKGKLKDHGYSDSLVDLITKLNECHPVVKE
jgi:hypothetical protein